jgi:exopolyphosphatase/guanosine-5'-triphosphate,3'-diphosphate pyrophosphatase
LLLADAVVGESQVTLQAVERHEIITKLGEGLDATGRLAAEPMDRALRGLALYAELITKAKVADRGGVATAATRNAANGPDFAARMAEVLGFQPRVIGGIEEARLTFLGATAGLRRDRSYAVVDVGGGSTEFVVGNAEPDYAVSIDIGSVRLTERVRALGLLDTATIRRYVDELFEDVMPSIAPDAVLGSGGTFVTLAAVAAGVTTRAIDAAGEVVMTFDDIATTVDRLAAMTIEEIAELPAVPAARAGVLQAGAVCAERAVAQLGGSAVQISVSDILDGLAMELAAPRWPRADAPGPADYL